MADPLALINLSDGRGHRFDAVVADGRLWMHGYPAEGLPRIDAQGGRLLPGLVDHHIHLMATAAARTALDLSDLGPASPALAARLRAAAAQGPVRAMGLDGADRLDATALDGMVSDVPVRVQARTGGMWVLNRAALAELGPLLPAEVERGADGVPTGRIWRGDALLRRPGPCPDLTGLGADLARHGITGVTDASVTTDAPQADAIARAGLPQRLTLMSGGALPPDPRWQIGPAKLVPDERALPGLDEMIRQIGQARAQDRCVAVHCVTHAELALTLAALATAGAWPGDRIEHGALIPEGALPVIAELGLIVVANPGFVLARGDRWLRQVDAYDRGDLCRLASLAAAGVPLLAGSDAPYGPVNPWESIRAACLRQTARGATLGRAEALGPEAALALFQPQGAAEPQHGAPADLVILRPGARIGLDPDPVAHTLIGGAVVYSRTTPAHPAPVPGVPP